MKKIVSIAVIVTLILSTLTVTACGKSEFGATVCTPETIAISAENAVGTMPAGHYLVKATCLEKATGTVHVNVKPAD